jgi:DNA polymerase-3 subunit gamma/tau
VPEHRGGFEMILLRMLAFRPAAAGTPAERAGKAVSAPPAQSARTARAARTEGPAAAVAAAASEAPAADTGWGGIVEALDLQGVARELAANCVLLAREGDAIRLMVDKAHAHLHNKATEERVQQALGKHFGAPVRLTIQVGEPEAATPARQRQQQERERMQAAISALENDTEVRTLKETFNARIVPETVEPLE